MGLRELIFQQFDAGEDSNRLRPEGARMKQWAEFQGSRKVEGERFPASRASRKHGARIMLC